MNLNIAYAKWHYISIYRKHSALIIILISLVNWSEMEWYQYDAHSGSFTLFALFA